jgi:predicted DNA-binding transcriptional regulator AlpA
VAFTLPLSVLNYRQLRPEKGIGFSRQHIDRLEKLNNFPKSFKAPGGNIKHWFEQVLDVYLLDLATGNEWSAERESEVLQKLKATYGGTCALLAPAAE